MEWVEAKDRLPPLKTSVLGYGPEKCYSMPRLPRIVLVYLDDASRWVEDCGCSGKEHDRMCLEITHWMPLPEAPSFDGCNTCHKGYVECTCACECLTCERQRTMIKEIERKKDNAYSERNELMCYLSKIFTSWLERHPDYDLTWENDWRNIVFINIPEGLFSWHIHDSENWKFDHLNFHEGNSWDGSTTQEKYDRMRAAINPLSYNPL